MTGAVTHVLPVQAPAAQPFDWFPFAALIILVVSVIYSIWLVRRDPGPAERASSIVAGE